MQVASEYTQGCDKEHLKMGKYLIAWLLGVPAVVLVVVYLLFN